VIPPTSLSSGAFELIALLGSTLRCPGPASGIRLISTYFDRSLCPLRSAPTSRGGTSASVSAAARAVTTVPAMPADAAVSNLLRDTAFLPNGPDTLSSLDVMLPSPFLPRPDGQIARMGPSQKVNGGRGGRFMEFSSIEFAVRPPPA